MCGYDIFWYFSDMAKEETLLSHPAARALAELYDQVPDVHFFAKDAQSRFVHANRALLERIGLRSVADIFGTGDADRYPVHVAAALVAGDRAVMDSGVPLIDFAEVLFDRHGRLEWFSTSKYPVLGENGRALGVVGITRPLARQAGPGSGDPATRVIDHVCAHPESELRVGELATRFGLSERQLHRRFLEIVGMPPREFILRTRVQAAAAAIRSGNELIAQVALRFRFCDQSAFTKAFRKVLGTTPAAYRRQVHG